MTQRILVYEHLSGGGWAADATDGAAAGALLAQGLAMRDAMVADLLDAADCSVSAAVCAPGNTLPHGAHPVWPRAGEPASAFVARQSLQHDLVWGVAPETGGMLARLQRAVGDARWLGCSAAAIALAGSKSATLQRLAAHGVQTPLAFATAPDIRRWVVKPDDGAGALDTCVHARLCDAREDQARRHRAAASATLEPWIEGEALSLSLLAAPPHAELLSINRQHIALDPHGTLSYGGVHVAAVRHDDARWQVLAGLATQVTRAVPGLRGFVGIDLVWHAQRGPVVIEVNPRVTCAHAGLSAALGRRLGAELLAAHRAQGAQRSPGERRETQTARAHV